MSADALMVTLDIDWAPDYVIDAVAGRLAARGVRATWFVTHASPAIDRLSCHQDLFELGIHPNFLPGSTQGATIDEVIDHTAALVPDAISMRTHSLLQSTPLFERILERTRIAVDASLYLPRARSLAPVEYRWKGRSLLRLPYFWEDDFELQWPAVAWKVPELLDRQGLKIFDFHPLLVYINAPGPELAESLRKPFRRVQEIPQRDLDQFVHHGKGIGTLFDQLLDAAAAGQSACLRDVYRAWVAEAP